jgi:hypothetical protein
MKCSTKNKKNGQSECLIFAGLASIASPALLQVKLPTADVHRKSSSTQRILPAVHAPAAASSSLVKQARISLRHAASILLPAEHLLQRHRAPDGLIDPRQVEILAHEACRAQQVQQAQHSPSVSRGRRLRRAQAIRGAFTAAGAATGCRLLVPLAMGVGMSSGMPSSHRSAGGPRARICLRRRSSFETP